MNRGIELTDQTYWDQFWAECKLPAEAEKTADDLMTYEILNIFDKFLSTDASKSVLEIGGAPGRFLVYLTKKFKYKAHALDYSTIGCQKTQENFKLLGLDVTVYQLDLLSSEIHPPFFDVVYSLGFVEHFEDIGLIIKKHLDLLKPGGILLIEIPNFLGIYAPFMRIFAPNMLSMHNLNAMDTRKWNTFERDLDLGVLFKGYLGGFSPEVLRNILAKERESMPWFSKLLSYAFDIPFRILMRMNKYFQVSQPLRRFNSRYWSICAIGVYRKPCSNPEQESIHKRGTR